jgi:hypothetical protein
VSLRGPAKTRIAGRLLLPVDDEWSGEEIVNWLRFSRGFSVLMSVGVAMAEGVLEVELVVLCRKGIRDRYVKRKKPKRKCEKMGDLSSLGN